MTEEKIYKTTGEISMSIGILTACESERHLSEPIYNELKKLGMQPYFIWLTQNNIVDSYHRANYRFKSFKYDFVLAVGDRPEQVGGVLAAFHNKIPIGHLYAGDHNTVATFDDKHRHAITLYSDIQFCSCLESTEYTIRLMRSAGLVPDANYVGATHFNNIDISNISDFGLVHSKPYVLILINSETIGNDNELIEDTVTKFMSLCTNGVPDTIVAKGNNDNEYIETKTFTEISKKVNNNIHIARENRTEHKYFLSLMKNCDAFITNSSAAIYEAPMFLKEDKIIHIGNRNKERTRIPTEAHDGKASQRVARLIKTFLEAKT